MFKDIPAWAKVAAAVVAVFIVLAILGPIITFLVKAIFGLALIALVLFFGYLGLQKLKS